AFDPDGTNPQSTSFQLFDRPVYVLGAGLSYVDERYGQARVTYRRTFWHISHGIEQERLGGNFQARVIEQLNLYGGVVYNFYIDRIDQAEAGAEWHFADPDLTVGGEYFRLVPFFDGDSIFNVFSLQGYDEGRARAAWQINDDLHVMARLGARFY